MTRFLVRHDRTVIAALALLALGRLTVAGATFPLFSPCDEQFHYDRVLRAARGRVRAASVPISDEAAAVIAGCESWEYLNVPRAGTAPDSMVPPWTLPADRRNREVERHLATWRGAPSREANEPPVYYLVAGPWLRLGELLGARGVRGAYWVRLLNGLFAAGLVVTAAALGRAWYPDRPLVRFGMPLFAAVLHADNWFAMNNDAPLALWCGLGLLLMAGGPPARPAGAGRIAAGGLVLGGALATKLTALPVAVVIALWPLWRGLRAKGRERGRGLRLGALGFAAAAVPPLGVAAANLRQGGSAWGLTEKFASLRLGVEVRPVGEMLANPLWSPAVAWRFLADLGASVVPGTLCWHRVPTPGGWLAALGLLAVAAGLVGHLLGRRNGGRRDELEAVSALAVLGAVAMVAALSVVFEFSDNLYPMPDAPYFSSGRYLNGALLPLALAVAAGWDRLSRAVGTPALFSVAAAAGALALLAHEAWLVRLAAPSAYNWIHLP